MESAEELNLLLSLPKEIIFEIIDYLSLKDVLTLSRVNKNLAQISLASLDQEYWEALTKTDFPNDHIIAQYQIDTENKKIIWRLIHHYAALRDYKDLTSTDIELRSLVKANKIAKIKALSHLTLEELQKKDFSGMSALEYAGRLPDKTIAKYFFQLIISKFSNEDTNWLYWISLCGLNISDTPKGKEFNVTALFNEKAGEILKNIVETDNLNLLKEIPTDLLKSHLSTLLLDSAKYGAIQIINFLLSPPHNMNVNYNWKYNAYTPLQLAVQCNQFNTVLLLLEKGAYLNDNLDRPINAYAYYCQGSPLLIAAREGHLALTKLLLHKGASTLLDFNQSSRDKGVVKTAIQNKNSHIAKLLITTPGAIQDFCKHISTMHNTAEDLAIFHDFIKYKIDLQATFSGQTPLQFAKINPKFPTALLEHLDPAVATQNFNSFANGAINHIVWEEKEFEKNVDFESTSSKQNR